MNIPNLLVLTLGLFLLNIGNNELINIQALRKTYVPQLTWLRLGINDIN